MTIYAKEKYLVKFLIKGLLLEPLINWAFQEFNKFKLPSTQKVLVKQFNFPFLGEVKRNKSSHPKRFTFQRLTTSFFLKVTKITIY